MATWITLNGDDLPIISQIEDIFDALEEPLEVAEGIAETAANALALAEDILQAIGDPSQIVREAINALINAIIGNTVNALYIKPSYISSPSGRGLTEFYDMIKHSFYDLGDPNRPNLSPSSASAGVIFMFSAPSFAELAQLAALFQRLFGNFWQEVVDYANSLPGAPPPYTKIEATGIITDIPSGSDPTTTFVDSSKIFPNMIDAYKGQRVTMYTGRNTGITAQVTSFDAGTGRYETTGFPNSNNVGDAYTISYNVTAQPPDWQRLDVVDVMPVIGDALAALARLRDSIPPTGGALQRLIDLLQAKVAGIQALLALIEQLRETLANLGSVVNLNVLPVPESAGDEGFIREMYYSSGAPDVADEAVAIGLVLYGGSEIYGILKLLFPLP